MVNRVGGVVMKNVVRERGCGDGSEERKNLEWVRVIYLFIYF